MIGQIRRDTALYALPEVVGVGQRRRGRPRQYGLKYTPERVVALPEHRVRLWLYGKWQGVRYRSAQVKARFLQGQVVRVVWVQFEAEDGTLGATRLLLATEADLRPDVIIKAYARRWPIEPLFNRELPVAVILLANSGSSHDWRHDPAKSRYPCFSRCYPSKPGAEPYQIDRHRRGEVLKVGLDVAAIPRPSETEPPDPL